MAKQTNQPAAAKGTPYPKDWASYTPEQKAQWRQQYQGRAPTARTVGAPKQYGPAPTTARPAQAPQTRSMGAQVPPTAQLGQEQLGQEQLGQEQLGQEQLGQEQLGEGQQLDAGQMMAMVEDLDQRELRKLVGRILLVVGEALYNLSREEQPVE